MGRQSRSIDPVGGSRGVWGCLVGGQSIDPTIDSNRSIDEVVEVESIDPIALRNKIIVERFGPDFPEIQILSSVFGHEGAEMHDSIYNSSF